MTLLVILWTVAIVGMPVAVFAAGRRIVRGRYGASARRAPDPSPRSTEPVDAKTAAEPETARPRRKPGLGTSRG